MKATDHGLMTTRGHAAMIQSVPEAPSRNGFALRCQKMKADIHRQLVEGLDLSRLQHINPERLRREIREMAVRLSRTSPEPLNEIERERLVSEVMDEAFGLGPLEGPMKDP